MLLEIGTSIILWDWTDFLKLKWRLERGKGKYLVIDSDRELKGGWLEDFGTLWDIVG